MAPLLERLRSARPGKSPSPTDERGTGLAAAGGEGGFTLAEVLVATVIVTVGLVALAELMAVTLRMQMLGRNETEAVRVAQDKVDQLISLDFDAAPSIQLGGSLTSNEVNFFDTTNGYTRRWLVEAGPNDPGSGGVDLRQLTMRVIPDSLDRRTTTNFELVTIIRRW